MHDVTFVLSGKFLDFLMVILALGAGVAIGYALVVFFAISGYWLWAKYANARDRRNVVDKSTWTDEDKFATCIGHASSKSVEGWDPDDGSGRMGP